jgi:hypothetical protein
MKDYQSQQNNIKVLCRLIAQVSFIFAMSIQPVL